ncbi:hypothetical protein LMG919_20260 [Xanthomonas vesicatoria]|nr:hypothetical protein LMG919_20260 [Xanthomonas vesicatoria]
MSPLFERFSAGEDGLAALLHALPPYAPPDRMQGWFAQAAAQADSARNATGIGSAQAASTDTADTLQFEPPATMGAVFAAAAAQVEQTQAAQRAAIHARLADGDDAAQVLGAPVHDATRAWLQQQQLGVPSTAPGIGGSALRENNRADTSVGDDTARMEAEQATSRSSSTATSGDASPAPVRPAPMPSPPDTQTGDAAHVTETTRTHSPAPRRARRQRWMPALALAASVTLAVGVGLQWQATAPPTAAMEAAPAAAAPADQAQAEAEKQTRSTQSTQAPLGQIQQPEPAPISASASTDADGTIEQRMHQPAPAPPPAFAPPPMPAPAQPAESRVVAPAPPVPPEAPSAPAPIAAAPAADLLLPSLPAPVAPSVSASVEELPSSSAHRIATVPDAANTMTAPARNTAKPAAAFPFAAATPADDTQSSGQLDAGNPAHSAPVAAAVSRAPQDAQLSRASSIKRAPLQKYPAAQQRVQEHIATQAPEPASTVAAPPASAEDNARRQAKPVQLLALTNAPDAWLDRALPARQHGPVHLRVWAADPEANAFRQWIDQLRKAYSQRNMPAQLDIARDPRLPTDRVRVETLDATQPRR